MFGVCTIKIAVLRVREGGTEGGLGGREGGKEGGGRESTTLYKFTPCVRVFTSSGIDTG